MSNYSLILYLLFQCLIVIDGFSNNSILNSGSWYKIGIVKSGVYKIDKNFLIQNNINAENINPLTIQVFGSGYNGQIPQLNSKSNLIQPQESNVMFNGNEDTYFDNEESIYFYLQSSDKIYYDSLNKIMDSEKNIYTDTAYYFITFNTNESKKIKKKINNINFTNEKNNAFFYYHHEEDIYSIIQSGREWFGDIFSSGDQKEIELFEFNENLDFKIKIDLVSRSTVDSRFNITFNDNSISEIEMDKIEDQIYGEKFIHTSKSFNKKFLNQQSNTLKIIYAGDNSAISYLDKVKINASIPLKYQGKQTSFYTAHNSVSSFTKYKIDSDENIYIWDITNPYSVEEYEVNKLPENYSVIIDDRFHSNNILFSSNDISYPISFESISNSNILNHNNPDLLIITHPLFEYDALRIKKLREQNDGMAVSLVTVDDIYNQFSSGNQDVSAIRNFIKYIYNTSNKNLKYVLIFGDCSYDFKNRVPNNTNFIPIYQSYNSSNNIYSYSSDDYYGFLEESEGIWIESSSGDHTLDVGVGRIPSKNLNDSKGYVDKLIRYSSQDQLKGQWKKNIYLVADDGDNNVHQNDAENHFQLLDRERGDYDVKKIYLDNFIQNIEDGVVTSSQAKNKLNYAIEDGSFILNYIGHGNEFLWTEEKILDENSIYSWKNRIKLPLFLTATCEFGKFDDPLITSGGELLLNKDDGGAIALLTTTRPVFSQTNYRVNNQFYKNVFTVENGTYLRLGEIFRRTKNKSLSGAINRNFSLLGDPSLQLSYPKYDIVVDSIDTLRATGKKEITGKIININDELVSSYNGNIYITIYDKISSKYTLGDESDPYMFKEWDNIIYKGISSVSNGEFDFEFIVPKNIKYTLGTGKISMYAIDTLNYGEALSYSNFLIGGTSENNVKDNRPPDIDIFIDSYNFKSGQTVSKNPLLIVDLFDLNGINITNTNTFHTMRAIVDDSITIALDNYFTNNIDDYQRGVIRYPLENLISGKHKIEIKVSDNYNNLSSKTVVFIIDNENKLKIDNLMNYPNPFTDFTTFSFDNGEFEEPLSINLNVYDLRGNIVYNYENIYEFSPEKIDNIMWNGKDLNNYPLPQGIYIYKLHVINLNNNASILFHKKLFKKK